MQATQDYRADYTVNQVANRLHERLCSYLEAQYHIRDIAIIEERRALLREIGTIGQEPYLETTPSYELGEPYAKLRLPSPVGETLTELSNWNPSIGVYPRPYIHQTEAMSAFFNDCKDIIVATGTGSGKTEVFLFTILGHLLQEAAERPASFGRSGFRALILYPMNALVSDQVSRLRRLFGDERLRDLFAERYSRFPRFGMYTSRTPYPGLRQSKKDQDYIRPILQYYLALDNPPAQLAPSDRAVYARLASELKSRGKWPAKNLEAFFGQDGDRWETRLKTQPGDRELYMRSEIQSECPDILVTNYSMLEYMLLRPIERNIFEQTREWLASDKRNRLILVLDEAHMYRGVAGAEVGLLIRRLQARLGIPRERMRCILTSASLGSGADAQQAVQDFAVGLTGHPIGNANNFRVITGQYEKRAQPRPGTEGEANGLAVFDLQAFFKRAENASDAQRAIAGVAEKLGWPQPPEWSNATDPKTQILQEASTRAYLYERLHGFGPLELLVSRTTNQAISFTELANCLFPNCQESMPATEVLLALGAFANNGQRVLLPTRVHLFFRGLPTLYACVNPICDQRRYKPGEKALLGRLYTEPRTHCSCKAKARVYELYTHRDCGAAFLHVFSDSDDRAFYWHEQGGQIENVGQPLQEDMLLVEPPHPNAVSKRTVEPIWLDITTGRVSLESVDSNHVLYHRPLRNDENSTAAKNGRGKKKKDVVEPEDEAKDQAPFNVCPACTKRSGRKIMDLATKGEQPFANLVREQLVLQPAVKKSSEQYPNGGRKVLLFSDGRQKAARLARDLPREVEFDSFRAAIALAAQRLNQCGKEATLDRSLYTAFISVCSDFHLHFFDQENRSQAKLLEDIRKYRDFYDADLATALEEGWDASAPIQYKQALLRQVADPFYSLYSGCAAVVKPTKSSSRTLKRLLQHLPPSFLNNDLDAFAIAWIQFFLDRTAFDPSISVEMRRRVTEYFNVILPSFKIGNLDELLRDRGRLENLQIRSLHDRLLEVLTEQSNEGGIYLQPSKLALILAHNDTWFQCMECGLMHYAPVFGSCSFCESAKLEERAPQHPYMIARKGYFLEPLRAVLNGSSPMHLTAEEHTAQLSQRDRGMVYATTEEYELRFQDVPLGPDKPPVDVLSCTTTMEVGIDIGSLTAIGLRNVPPQRENYQQRAGRAGRRGASISTVVTYAQGGPHDSYYYQYPRVIISGEPRRPKVKMDNRRLARRHINSFLIQTFFHEQLDTLNPEQYELVIETRNNLVSALGSAESFFRDNGSNVFSFKAFAKWVDNHVLHPETHLLDSIATWLPDEICDRAENEQDILAPKHSFAKDMAMRFIKDLKVISGDYDSGCDDTGGSGTDHGEDLDDAGDGGSLIDLLFDKDLLPSYAFPTNLCTFYVFERDDKRVRIKERPQQGKDKALSEYAPGRLLVINKQTYRVGGIYVEGADPATPAESLFEKPLRKYVFCPVCTYVSLDSPGITGSACPICGNILQESEILDPPGFSPERGRALNERDRDQEISYATSAQFPTPVDPDQFEWRICGAHLRHAFKENRHLVIVNKGPQEHGFRVCESCGAAWPEADAPRALQHQRPYQVDSYVLQRLGVTHMCSGPMHAQSIYLGYTFATDLLLIRIAFRHVIDYDPRHPWLHDALRTLSEAVALAASRRLDIDPGELSAGYRLMPSSAEDGDLVTGLADIYLFDTASGGAGYSAEAGEMLATILNDTLDLLRNCPAQCERSCTKCLRHYGNRFWHERLDRHLAIQLLMYAQQDLVPPIADEDVQSEQLAALQRYLTLEGWESRLGERIAGIKVPLSVKLERTGTSASRKLAIGTYPALLNPISEVFSHPLDQLDTKDGISVVTVPDYVVVHDLPTALKQLGLAH